MLAECRKALLRATRDLPQPRSATSSSKSRSIPTRSGPRCAAATASSTSPARPIRDVHVRLMDRELDLVELDFPARGSLRTTRSLAIASIGSTGRWAGRDTRARLPHAPRAGAASATPAPRRDWSPNGTFLNNFELAPRIGMSDVGLLQEPAARRRHGLPPNCGRPRLEDMGATTTCPYRRAAGPRPTSPSRPTADQIADRAGQARCPSVSRTAGAPRASSPTRRSRPSSRSSRRAMPRNADVMAASNSPSITIRRITGTSTACSTRDAGLDRLLQANFGPYQFDQARIIEFPGY